MKNKIKRKNWKRTKKEDYNRLYILLISIFFIFTLLISSYDQISLLNEPSNLERDKNSYYLSELLSHSTKFLTGAAISINDYRTLGCSVTSCSSISDCVSVGCHNGCNTGAGFCNAGSSSSSSGGGSSCGTIDSDTQVGNNEQVNGTCFTINTSNIIITGRGKIIITGNGTGYGFNISDVTNVTIKNIEFRNFSTGGFFSGASNNTIFNTTINNTQEYGIHLKSSSNKNNLSENNFFNNIDDNKQIISLDSSSYNTIYKNIIDSSDEQAILLSSSNYNNITYNQLNLTGTPDSTIGVIDCQGSASDHNRITDNTISTSNGHGIYWCRNSHIINNTFYLNFQGSNSAIAINLKTGDNNIIKKNTIIATGGRSKGISFDGSDNNVVHLNMINLTTGEYMHGIGFKTNAGTNNSITNNFIYTNSTGLETAAVYFSSATYNNNTFTNNIFQSTQEADIYARLTSTSPVSEAYFINNTINKKDIAYGTGNTGKIYFKWYVTVNVTDDFLEKIQGATVEVFNKSNVSVTSSSTNFLGESYFTLNEFWTNGTFNHTYAPHIINVSHSIYESNITTINISQTNSTKVHLIIRIGDTPYVYDVRPYSGYQVSYNNTIEIAANATDNIGISIVQANITLPNGTSELIELENGTNHPSKFNYSFNVNKNIGQHNITFIANDTDNNINNVKTTTFTVIDPTYPNVTELFPTAGIQVNTRDNLTLGVTVIDEVAISAAVAQITYPNGTIDNISLTLADSAAGIFNITFSSDLPGNYNITFMGNDTSNNINNTEKTYFSVKGIKINNMFPANGTTLNGPVEVPFQCNSNSYPNNLVNVSVYSNVTGHYIRDINKTINGTVNVTSLKIWYICGTFEWNCLSYNTDKDYDWGDQNHTLIINCTAEAQAASDLMSSYGSGNYQSMENMMSEMMGSDIMNEMSNEYSKEYGKESSKETQKEKMKEMMTMMGKDFVASPESVKNLIKEKFFTIDVKQKFMTAENMGMEIGKEMMKDPKMKEMMGKEDFSKEMKKMFTEQKEFIISMKNDAEIPIKFNFDISQEVVKVKEFTAEIEKKVEKTVLRELLNQQLIQKKKLKRITENRPPIIITEIDLKNTEMVTVSEIKDPIIETKLENEDKVNEKLRDEGLSKEEINEKIYAMKLLKDKKVKSLATKKTGSLMKLPGLNLISKGNDLISFNGKPTSGDLLKPNVENIEINPGEKLKIKGGLTVGGERKVTLTIKDEKGKILENNKNLITGSAVNENTIESNTKNTEFIEKDGAFEVVTLTIKNEEGKETTIEKKIFTGARTGGIVDVDIDRKVLNFYMVAPIKEGTYSSNDYQLEVNINKKIEKEIPLSKENKEGNLITTAAILDDFIGEGDTEFAEIYGPFEVKDEEGMIVAQELNYDPEQMKGKYQIVLKISDRSGLIAENIFIINFDTGEVISEVSPTIIKTDEDIAKILKDKVETVKLIENKNVQFLSQRKFMSLFGGAKSLTYSGRTTAGDYLKIKILESKDKIIKPGESFEEVIKVRPALTTERKEKKVKVKLLTGGEEVFEQENIIIEEPKRGGILSINAPDNLLDVYMVIPKGNPTDKEYSFEFTLNKKGGGSEFADLYGPYKVSEDGLILAQEFIYNHRDFKGQYIAALKLYSNGKLIEENKYNVNFNTGTLLETTEDIVNVSFGKIFLSYSMILLLILMTLTIPSFYMWNFKREIEEIETKTYASTITPPIILIPLKTKEIPTKEISTKERLHQELESINKNISELKGISNIPLGLQIISTTEKEKGRINSTIAKRNVNETLLDKRLNSLNKTIHGYPKSKTFRRKNYSVDLDQINQKIIDVEKPIKKVNVKSILPTIGSGSRLNEKYLLDKKSKLARLISRIKKNPVMTEPIVNEQLSNIDREIANLCKTQTKTSKIKVKTVSPSTVGHSKYFNSKELTNKKNWLTSILNRSEVDSSKIIERKKIEPVINSRILEINQELEKLKKSPLNITKRSKIKIKSVAPIKGRATTFRKKDLKKEQKKIIEILTRSKKRSKKFEIEKSEELKRIEEEIVKLRKKQNGNKN